MKKITTVFFIIFLAGAGTLLVHHKKAKLASAPLPADLPKLVRVATAHEGSIADTRTYLARVEALKRAELASRINGLILKVIPREGDSVLKGQILVDLDDTELRNSLAEAEARLKTLKRNVGYWEKEMARDNMLFEKGAIAEAMADMTADRLNDARGRFQAQKEQCNIMLARLSYARIKSPGDGLVSRRLADPGDMASPGKPLLVIDDISKIKVCFDIPQEDLTGISKGMPVIVETENGLYHSKISRLYSALNPNRTLTAEADMPVSSGLACGSYCTVKVVFTNFEKAVLVPEECLVSSHESKTSVITVKQGRTIMQAVKVNLVRQGEAAVTGIEPGTLVIRNAYLGWNRLGQGEFVEVIR